MKQFSKFKQFADKAFVRPDRTEVMSEDLLYAERHIELMKLTCETTVKKLGACIQVSGQTKEGTTIARRIKKVPEWALGSSLDELGKKYEEGSVLGTILTEAGKIEMTIGTQMTAHEGKIEPIIADLQKLVDNEFPGVYKLKRNLAKLAENMDTAKSKLQQANRHSTTTATGGRIENFKDDLDESQVKVEQCRDNLASEMYQLLSKQTDIAESIVQFLKYQQEYHQCISNTLKNLLPEVEAALANSSNKPVYGTDLSEHLVASGRTIAYPLEFCVCCLLETGLTEEGLFRIAGNEETFDLTKFDFPGASKVKKLKSAFNAWILDSDLKGLMGEFNDPHVIGNALKCYLRELPNPLLTTELYNDWIEAIRVSDNQEKLQALWNVVQRLPVGNRDNLRYLIKFLRKLSDHQDVNKMSSANIAIVLGPNLLWSPQVSDDISGDSTPMGMNMAMTHWFSSIVEQLVTYADWFFPGEMDFYVTCEKPEPEWVSVNLRHLAPSGPGSGQGALPNGSSTEDMLDDNQALKRSQSNSSLDEHSTQNGSPKPVVRRKVKPAPLPPTTTYTTVMSKSADTPKLPSDPPPKYNQHPASQPSRPPPLDSATKPYVTNPKREGMWIPPSPSQMAANRSSLVPQGQHGSSSVSNPQAPKTVPPKPPQPNFLKDKSGSTTETSIPSTVSSTLRHKSSFSSRTPSKMDSKESGAEGTQFASLPRRFHTENSYKNNTGIGSALPRPQLDVFMAKDTPVETQKQNIPSDSALPKPSAKGMSQEIETAFNLTKETETVLKKDSIVAPIGFEKITSEIVAEGFIDSKPVNVRGVAESTPVKNLGEFKATSSAIEPKVTATKGLTESKPAGGSAESKLAGGSAESKPAGGSAEPKPVGGSTELKSGGSESTTTGTAGGADSRTQFITGSVGDPKPKPTSPSSESSRPVPAPRSSLHREMQAEVTAARDLAKPIAVTLQKERPCVKAKPRDLGKRSHGEGQSIPSHCRNSSGSGPEFDGDVMDGKASSPSSQPPSRTHSRMDSNTEILGDVIGEHEKEGRGSIPSEDEVGEGGSPKTTPYRPPRPNPPAPPKAKMGSTDF